jgi:hypothetical protein
LAKRVSRLDQRRRQDREARGGSDQAPEARCPVAQELVRGELGGRRAVGERLGPEGDAKHRMPAGAIGSTRCGKRRRGGVAGDAEDGVRHRKEPVCLGGAVDPLAVKPANRWLRQPADDSGLVEGDEAEGT